MVATAVAPPPPTDQADDQEVLPAPLAPSLQRVPLPLLADAASYEPCTFDYEASIDAPTRDDEVCLREWIDVFRHSNPTFAANIRSSAENGCASPRERGSKADAYASFFSAALDRELERARARARARGGSRAGGEGGGRVSCVSLCRLRDGVLASLGFRDVFLRVKRAEDAAALALLPGVLKSLDDAAGGAGELGGGPRARLELAVRGVLAGNVFDLGAAASAELFASGEGGGADAFRRTRDGGLLPRPWAVDDLDALLDALLPPEPAGGAPAAASSAAPAAPFRKAILFADNAGSDVLLGLLPFARELLRLGVPSVVLAANSAPTLNDTTAAELGPLLIAAAKADPDPSLLPRAVASGSLRVVASGSVLPVIDLRLCSPELAAECVLEEGEKDGVDGAAGGILLLLEGMGRGIETNLRASFSCAALRIGVIKHPEVARCLKGRMYDPVVRFTAAASKREGR